jgi:hypothetical protein
MPDEFDPLDEDTEEDLAANGLHEIEEDEVGDDVVVAAELGDDEEGPTATDLDELEDEGI